MKAIKRHQEIIELVQTQGFVSTDELVERFSVSPQTIRRDLNELADDNKIRRNHGGATITSSAENSSYQTRQIAYQKEKSQIALELANTFLMALPCLLILEPLRSHSEGFTQ